MHLHECKNDKGGFIMCDVKKYYDMFEDISKLTAQDTLQLVKEAETDEIKEFYAMIGNYLLQKKQREVIERNLF